MEKMTLSINEAASLIGVSRSASYTAAQTGYLATGIRGLRVCSRMVVPRVDIESKVGPLPGTSPETW